MATPVGHAIAGAGIYKLLAGSEPTESRIPLGLAVLFAIAPDLDFLPGIYFGMPALYHQGISHSLIVGIVLSAATVLIPVRGWSRRRLFWLLFASYSSHLVLDLFGPDKRAPFGIPLFWPVDSDAYLSPIRLLLGVRHSATTDASVKEWLIGVLSPYNLLAIALEALVVAAVLIVMRYVQLRNRAGLERG